MVDHDDVDSLRELISVVSRDWKTIQGKGVLYKLFLLLGYPISSKYVDAQIGNTAIVFSKNYKGYRIFWDDYDKLEEFVRDEIQSIYNDYDLTVTTSKIHRTGASDIECRCLIRLPRTFSPKSSTQSYRGLYQDKDEIMKAALLLAWTKLQI